VRTANEPALRDLPYVATSVLITSLDQLGEIVFLFSRPGEAAIRSFLAAQKDRPFSYTQLGASRDRAPEGYAVDHNRIELGRGAAVFERATDALRRWQMFQIPWIELCWPGTPIEAGATVGVLVSHLGFWSLNACRIVYVIQDHGTCERFGFAYGTLVGHAEIGEERFTVEFHSETKSVWYDIYAFSRPSSPAARLAYGYARRLQRRFARDSKLAMKSAVENAQNKGKD
jgi:uncharacterized protein (UPF0548 family)